MIFGVWSGYKVALVTLLYLSETLISLRRKPYMSYSKVALNEKPALAWNGTKNNMTSSVA